MGNNLTKKNLKLFFLLQFLHFILNTDQKNPKLINFTKWIKLGSIVEQMLNLQQSPYNLQPIKPLMDYLLAACGFENHETSAYKFSKLIEPDNQNDQKHNFSQTFSPRVLSVQLLSHPPVIFIILGTANFSSLSWKNILPPFINNTPWNASSAFL